MKYIKNHISVKDAQFTVVENGKKVIKTRRPTTRMNATSITIHNTGNPSSTARNERNWLVNPLNNREASWNIAVDEKEAIEAIPLNEVAYHAGNREGNLTSIGIEICESGDQNKVWSNAVKLVAKMLHERNWSIDKVRTHQSWSGKNCPRLILPQWSKFIGDIEKELMELNGAKETKETKETDISSWAIDAQKWVVEKGISDGRNPKENVTREQLWTMLHRMQEGK